MIQTDIINAIKANNPIIIHRHINPDPDALGSQVGLAETIRASFPDKQVYQVGSDTGNLSWLAEEQTIKDDVYFKGLTIPISQFIYHANKDGSIVVPLEAYSVVEWRNTYTPSEPFGSIINTTKEDDNPLLLIFDFKQ